MCFELTLFGCKFTQKIRINILFSKKSHIRHLFFIEIQHKTHLIRSTQNMHIFRLFAQHLKHNNKQKVPFSQKEELFYKKLLNPLNQSYCNLPKLNLILLNNATIGLLISDISFKAC